MTKHTVRTAFGDVLIFEEEDGIRTETQFDSNVFVIGNGRESVKFYTKKLPKLYDEVTQNGHTFEVQGTRVTSTGKLQVENEQGVWEDYQ